MIESVELNQNNSFAQLMNTSELEEWGLRKQIESKRKRRQEQITQRPANAIQLPAWPDQARAAPNVFLRSALFGVIGKGKKRYLKGESIASIQGFDIFFTGETLDQGDLDLLLSLLHISRYEQLTQACKFTSYHLLKIMNKTDTGKNRKILQTRIERLRANAITIQQSGLTFVGGLIDEAYKNESNEWIVFINPKIQLFFEAQDFTYIDWKIRQELSGHPLAQWLDAFYASHVNPYAYKVETIWRLCGSQMKRLDHFRESLRKELNLVKITRERHNKVFIPTISNKDLLSVIKD